MKAAQSVNNAAGGQPIDVYRRMIEEIQDYAIIVLNPEGIITNWNRGAEKIKQYTESEIINRHFSIFYFPEDVRSGLPQQLLEKARSEGRAYHEGWRRRKDGSRFWGSITITALHDEEGAVIGFTKVTRDLTDKKFAEDKLAAYTAELEAQNRELEQFAYVASHDLQEPLRKIQTFSGLIRENIGDREFVERYFNKLESSAARMSELIRSLLGYSRLGKARFEATEVDLNGALEEARQDLELVIAEKGAVLETGNLPVVQGSSVQLRQLFFNLLSNALKFSDKAPVIQVACSIEEGSCAAAEQHALKDYYCIEVRDNGIGFHERYRDKIFTLFQRLHQQDQYTGTGIGLALCKKIVDNHGGYITARSAPGEGSVFSVYLPVTAEKPNPNV